MTIRRKRLSIGDHALECGWWGAPAGDRPTLVLLHEGLGCVDLWRDFPAALHDATGCPVFAYSRRGYGGSDPAPLPKATGYMHDEARGDLPALIAAAGIGRHVLLGHSDGASIAIIRAGEAAEAQTPIALALLAAHVFVEEISVASIAEAKLAFEQGDLRARLARYHGPNVDCAFYGWNSPWLAGDFRAWNLEAFLPAIRVPILAIQGAEDQYGSAAQIAAIRAGAGGPVETAILADCGHAPHLDQPAATLEAIAAFVADVTSAP